MSAAVDLLNANAAAFNLLEVLEVLPGSWSLQLVTRFLCESLRTTTHDRRMRGLEKSLARMDNLRQRHAWVRRTLGLHYIPRQFANNHNVLKINLVVLYCRSH